MCRINVPIVLAHIYIRLSCVVVFVCKLVLSSTSLCSARCFVSCARSLRTCRRREFDRWLGGAFHFSFFFLLLLLIHLQLARVWDWIVICTTTNLYTILEWVVSSLYTYLQFLLYLFFFVSYLVGTRLYLECVLRTYFIHICTNLYLCHFHYSYRVQLILIKWIFYALIWCCERNQFGYLDIYSNNYKFKTTKK